MIEQTIEIHGIYILAGLAVGLLIGAGFFLTRILKLERQNAELSAQIKSEKTAHETAMTALDQRFKLTAQDALKQSSEAFLQLAQSKLNESQKDSAHDLEKRQKSIETLVKPIEDHLKALSQSAEQAKGTDEALRSELTRLSKETAKLVGVLRDPSAQGQWGEYILEGILEKSGLMKGIHYDTQVTLDGGRARPDAVIRMQDGFNIIIDAKAPLNDVAHALSDQEMSEDDYARIMNTLARQVREHVKTLGKKGYWEGDLNSPDFTVMFLPSEHLYSMALRADPTLVDLASSSNVIIASPTLLMSLLRVVAMSWRQVELAQNAQEISERGMELYNRLLTFTGHIEKVGKNLQSAMQGYDSAIGSLEKSVLPAARKFKELQNAQGTKDLPELNPVEQTPRALSLTAEDEEERLAEKKRA